MNAGLRCSKYSGCRVDCIPNYKLPNGATQLFVACQDGKWIAEGVDWDYVPSCERKTIILSLLLAENIKN